MNILKKVLGSLQRPPPIDYKALEARVRESDVFKNVPQENLAEVLKRVQSVAVKTGDAVIRQGEEGDFFYILAAGSATVTRQMPDTKQPQVLADLAEGRSFGEEALISFGRRNASVTMKTDGVLYRLSKNDFNTYVKDPLVQWLSPAEAQERTRSGSQWLDVREEEESRRERLTGAVSLPISTLRGNTASLDKNTAYVCYCENGRLSSTAAFLLNQLGYKAAVLRGGLKALRQARQT